MPKYDIDVKLTGTDGNAFSIMSKVSKAMRDEDVPSEEINKYMEESMSGDYGHVLSTAMKWVKVE